MVYKLGNVSDLALLPSIDQHTWRMLYEFTSVLTNEYGEGRNVDSDDGGYVLYAEPGTSCEKVKACFDYSTHTIEYINCDLDAPSPLCATFFLLSNEYVVVIVMSIDDGPAEIVKEIN